MPAVGSLADFRHAYFGPYDHYMGWHDGYEADFAVLDCLTATDRLTAEAELCEALRANRADPRVIMGLGHLRSTAALPLLYASLPYFGIYVLQAIARIAPAALDADRVLALLRSSRLTEFQLSDIVIGLGAYFTLSQLDPRLLAQLLALLAHRHFLVRNHALNTIRRLHHLPDPKAGDGQRTTRADTLRDTIFCLLTADNAPAKFSQAQQLLQTQLAALPPAAPPQG